MLVKVMWTELVMVQRPSLRPEDKKRATVLWPPSGQTLCSRCLADVLILACGSALSRKFFFCCNEADAAAPGLAYSQEKVLRGSRSIAGMIPRSDLMLLYRNFSSADSQTNRYLFRGGVSGMFSTSADAVMNVSQL